MISLTFQKRGCDFELDLILNKIYRLFIFTFKIRGGIKWFLRREDLSIVSMVAVYKTTKLKAVTLYYPFYCPSSLIPQMKSSVYFSCKIYIYQ